MRALASFALTETLCFRARTQEAQDEEIDRMTVQSTYVQDTYAQDIAAAKQPRDIWLSLRRGLAGRCPACGKGKMFRAYLKVNDACPACGEDLFHHRADDAPPYFTILIVAHVVGGAMLTVEETASDLPLWLHFLVWPSLTLALSLVLLPIVKGALIAHQWALRMHGFETAREQEMPNPGAV
jgi:uncharacterized protein (DUF983 family)